MFATTIVMACCIFPLNFFSISMASRSDGQTMKMPPMLPDDEVLVVMFVFQTVIPQAHSLSNLRRAGNLAALPFKETSRKIATDRKIATGARL